MSNDEKSPILGAPIFWLPKYYQVVDIRKPKTVTKSNIQLGWQKVDDLQLFC